MQEDTTRAQAAPGAPGTGEQRIKRLRFRAWRRGFKEADLVLGRFADRHAAALDPVDLDRLEALLDAPDTEVYAWIVGSEAPPPAHDHALLARLREFASRLHELDAEPPA